MSAVSDPLAEAPKEDAPVPVENGSEYSAVGHFGAKSKMDFLIISDDVRLPRAGKRRKVTGIIKVVRKKIKKPKKVSEVEKVVEEAPGADSDGEYEVSKFAGLVWCPTKPFEPCNDKFLIYQKVEDIVGHKKEKGKTLFRVKWKGYSSAQDSWLPSAELSCKDILKKYKNKMKRETKDVYTVS